MLEKVQLNHSEFSASGCSSSFRKHTSVTVFVPRLQLIKTDVLTEREPSSAVFPSVRDTVYSGNWEQRQQLVVKMAKANARLCVSAGAVRGSDDGALFYV